MKDTTFLKNDHPGSLSDIYEIKILICYLLHSLDFSFTKEQVNYIFQFNEIVNYFSFCQALNELIQMRHVEETFENEKGEKILSLTPLGVNTAETLYKILPKSTRDHILETGRDVIEKSAQEKDQTSWIEKVADGYLVHLVIHNIGSDLMDLTLFAPDRKGADQIVNQFTSHTVQLYQGILAILQQDTQGLFSLAKELSPKEQE